MKASLSAVISPKALFFCYTRKRGLINAFADKEPYKCDKKAAQGSLNIIVKKYYHSRKFLPIKS